MNKQPTVLCVDQTLQTIAPPLVIVEELLWNSTSFSITKVMFKEATVRIAATTRPSVQKTNLVHVKLFYREEEEDPHEWVELFDHAADANNWAPERKVKIASGYLCGLAAYWYDNFK
ncbi:11868_t:CDS:2 [Cetraspora pellucida]|uniref:11868_t:CDS:1 n=1 Tax=Cetraspora pellucida TaxID=1433469 RepID=A0ACA9NPB1_9GLOM|nr:11868_t:CDS:2 [Cetraspora pellucida]